MATVIAISQLFGKVESLHEELKKAKEASRVTAMEYDEAIAKVGAIEEKTREAQTELVHGQEHIMELTFVNTSMFSKQREEQRKELKLKDLMITEINEAKDRLKKQREELLVAIPK